MKLTDWLGNEYGPGDTVIYPVGVGRSIEMQMAEVVDIWIVYMCPDDYKWKRLDEGAEVPTKTLYKWDRDREERVVDEIKPVETQLRVKLQPLGEGSRGFRSRTTTNSYWLDPDGNVVKNLDEMYARLEEEHGPQYEYTSMRFIASTNWHPEDFGYSRVREDVKPKPVMLTQGIDNITLLRKGESYKCGQCGSPNPVLHTFHTKENSLKCPTCDSPDPKLHPATQAEGEVAMICKDDFHNTSN